MINASVGALPGLIPAFVILAALMGVPAIMIAKAKGQPVILSLLLSSSLAGVIAVTMMPGIAGGGQANSCDVGLPGVIILASESAQLNVLLFIPLSFFSVLLFRRPVLALAATITLTCGIELVQGWTSLGRACSYDDVKANTLGGIIGILLGCLYLWGQRRRLPFTKKDAIWGGGAVVAAAAVIAMLFQTTITAVNFEELHHRAKAKFGDSTEKLEWMAATAKRLYGDQVKLGESEVVMVRDNYYRLHAKTDRGTVTVTWPDRKLVEMTAENNHDDNGSLSAAEMRKSAEMFARKWFSAEIAGAEVEFRPIKSKQTHGMHLLSYRRYSHNVMMPMRVDIIVTTAGRVTNLAARSIPDPALPTVTLSKANAKQYAERDAAGMRANPVSLMAQRIDGAWRPVWLIGLRPKAEPENFNKETSVFLDAVTGKKVTPEKLGEDDPSSGSES